MTLSRAPQSVAVSSGTSEPRQPRTYRPELQGLRALAVVLVVVYHVWLGRVSGGVDVFFLISGFLITGQMVRGLGRGGVRLRPMWGRMIKRLFPAALTVLLVTMALGVALLPEVRWLQTIREVVAAALYVENWRLAADATDYFAQHNTASVVQHFWSLSIQGQFFVVWPLLLVGVGLLARWARWRLTVTVAVVLGVVFAGSLGWSVWLTAVQQPLAYFHAGTRVWEFALGGLLALGIQRWVLPRGLRIVLGWAGVIALVCCGLLLQVGRVFPGYAALWPTLAGAAVILAGATSSRLGADRWLSSRPLEYVGNLSYALYLWHWPVLLFYLVARDRTEVGLRGGAVIIGTAALLSVLTYHLIEQPARESRIGVHTRWGAYRFGILLLIPVLLAAGGWQVLSDRKAESYQVAADDPKYPGAIARTGRATPAPSQDTPLAPSFIALPSDWSPQSKDCTASPRNKELVVCTSKVTGTPKRRIVVVGDSHPRQYLAALRPIAERRNWQLIEILRSGCPFSTESELVRSSQPCRDWNADAAQEIIERRPDAVFTQASREVRVGLTEQTPPGFVAQWRKLDAAGIPVLAVRDNPRYDTSPSDCVARKGRDAPECATPRDRILPAEPPYKRIPDVPANVSFLDFSDYICTETVCPPEIGNVLLYLDTNHLTATYTKTMAPIVEQEIVTAMNW